MKIAPDTVFAATVSAHALTVTGPETVVAFSSPARKAASGASLTPPEVVFTTISSASAPSKATSPEVVFTLYCAA